MIFNLCLMLAAGANAALVTEYVHVTQYVFEDVHVFVDSDGKPVSTSIDYVATTFPVTQAVSTSAAPTTAAPETTSAAAASSSADSHNHEYSNGPFQIILSSEAPAPTTQAETSEAPASTTQAVETSEAPAPTTQAVETSEAPSPTTQAIETPQEPSSTSAAAPATSSSSDSDSSSGSGSGQTFEGQATYYDVGLGACGITNTDDDLIVALNVDQFNEFGSMSNGNPVCNKKIVLKRGSKSVEVAVTDKCPGCKYGDLDLSPAAFNKIATEAEGRVAITWQWA